MANLENTAITRPKPPDLIPGYRLEKLVGKGGMGEVHRATQLSLGRTVAVKLLAAELAKDRSFVTRFEKEGAALASLSHPNVVSIVDKGRNEATYFLVMEYIDGPSLREVMRSPLLDPLAAVKMVVEIGRGIDYAHSRGVIHRDLKPENILFDEQAGGIAKVTDFGLAGFAQDTAGAKRFNVTETHVSMGTLSYMAPEQRTDAKNADHRADIYSLGVILYELLAGELPMGNFDPPSQINSNVDRRLDEIIARCLKPGPDDRYQKVSELLSELEPLVPATFASSLPSKIGPVERAKQAARKTLGIAGKVAGGIVVAAAAVVLITSMARDRQQSSRKDPGIELTTDYGSKWPLTTTGRVDPPQHKRRVVLGEGPDTVSVVAWGRQPVVKDGQISFSPPESDSPVGRAVLDVDFDGEGISFVSEVETLSPPKSRWARFKALLVGAPPQARSALLLVGEPGRYVALIVTGDDSPPVLEWALGNDRRGTMSSPTFLKRGANRLELNIDDKTGDLRAFVGAKGDRRLVGDPISLGPGWKKLFIRSPRAAVGCLDGACLFSQVAYLVETQPPPPPPVISIENPSSEDEDRLANARGAVKKPVATRKPGPGTQTPPKRPAAPKKK
jgi:serine/threonine protein kinase